MLARQGGRNRTRGFGVRRPVNRCLMAAVFPPMKSLAPVFRLVAAMLALLTAVSLPAAPKKVLVVTVTTGFRHASIPTAEKILAQLGRESGQFTVDYVRQPEGMPRTPNPPRPGKDGDSPAHHAAMKKYEQDLQAFEATWMPKVRAALEKLSPANLKSYDAVLFASTTGDLPLPDPQGFLDWIAAGHAFIGIHAATDTFHGFPPYLAMIGGEFRTHGPQVTVECHNQDSAHAACAPLPKTWTVFDEIYQMKSFERAKVHGLLSLDKLQVSADPTPVPGDYPVAWSKMHGKGRVFYTSMGHREDVWTNPKYQGLLLGALAWTTGTVDADVSPNIEKVTPGYKTLPTGVKK